MKETEGVCDCLSVCCSVCPSTDDRNLKVGGAAVVLVDGGVDVAFVGEILDGFSDLRLRESLLGELLEDVADPWTRFSVLAQGSDVSQNLVLHSRQPFHRRRS